jgi:hypothetical protein
MNTIRLGGLVSACALTCLLPVSSAFADATGPTLSPALAAALANWQQKPTQKDTFTFDYGIPTSPALTLIGVSNGVSSPSTSMKPFVFSVPASYGGSKDSQAFSFDFSAMWLSQGLSGENHETYGDFLSKDYMGQLPYRIRFEGALALGDDGNGDATKAKPSRLAFGLSASLLTSNDPVTVKTPDGKNTVWLDCTDKVFSSDMNKKYQVAYDADPNLSASDEIARVAGDVRVALHNLNLPAVPPATKAALADKAWASVTDCLGGKACAKYDDGTLRAALDSKDLAKARDQLNTIQDKATADTDSSSLTLAKKLGIPQAFDACVAAANAAARQGADIDVGGGITWSGTAGKAEGFTDASGALWVSGRLPFGIFQSDLTKLGPDSVSYMLGGSLRANWSQTLATGNAATPMFKADVYDAWLGLERYSATTRFAAQVGYMDTEAINPAQKIFSKSGSRWLVSASIRADKLFGGFLNGTLWQEQPDDAPKNGVWVNVTYGTASGTVTTLDDKTVMVSLSYSPSDPYNLFGEGTN